MFLKTSYFWRMSSFFSLSSHLKTLRGTQGSEIYGSTPPRGRVIRKHICFWHFKLSCKTSKHSKKSAMLTELHLQHTKENVKYRFVRLPVLFLQDQFDSSSCHWLSICNVLIQSYCNFLCQVIQAQYVSIIYHFKDPPVVSPQRLFVLSCFITTGSRFDTHRLLHQWQQTFPSDSFTLWPEVGGLQLRVMYYMTVKL